MKEYKVPIQSLIDHIKTAVDVDPWAKEMAEKLLKKHIPTPITHEATIYAAPTCPWCKNVVGKREKWGDRYVNIQWKHCLFCGQALKWD